LSSRLFLTPYGGVNSIGGNTFLIECGSSKIFLDFGLDFGKHRSYFDFPLNIPKTTSALVMAGVLPRICSHDGRRFFEYCEIERGEGGREWKVIEKPPEENFSVIVSHAHMDHVGNSIFLPSSVPIWLSTFSKIYLTARYTVKRGGTLSRLALSNKAKVGESGLEKPNFEILRNDYRVFRNLAPFKVQDFIVEPYAVDHSIPGAFGFILRAGGFTVGYSGDFRMHGVAKDFSKAFVEKLSGERLDYFLCEGTNLGLNQVREESEVESSVEHAIKRFFDCGGEHAIVILSQTNVDRVSKMYGVARRLNLNLYLSDEIFLLTYYILASELRERIISPLPALLKDPSLEKRAEELWPGSGEVKSYGVLVGKDRTLVNKRLKELAEKLSLNCVSEEDFSRIPSRSLILLHGQPSLLDKRFSKNSMLIVSTSEHEDEEALYELDRFINQAMLLGVPMLRVHSSGHVSVVDLIEVIGKVRPKNLIPIHTLYQNFFKSYFERVYGVNVILPKEGQTIAL